MPALNIGAFVYTSVINALAVALPKSRAIGSSLPFKQFARFGPVACKSLCSYACCGNFSTISAWRTSAEDSGTLTPARLTSCPVRAIMWVSCKTARQPYRASGYNVYQASVVQDEVRLVGTPKLQRLPQHTSKLGLLGRDKRSDKSR